MKSKCGMNKKMDEYMYFPSKTSLLELTMESEFRGNTLSKISNMKYDEVCPHFSLVTTINLYIGCQKGLKCTFKKIKNAIDYTGLSLSRMSYYITMFHI